MIKQYRLLLLCVVCLFAGAAFGSTFGSVDVPGTANIYTAEGNAPLTCCNAIGSGDTAAILALNFGAGSDQVLTISSATGTVGCQNVLTNGPDGGCTGFGNTNITALGGISGIQATTDMFLVGVFLADTPPGSAPAGLDYSSAASYAQLSYSPLLGQVFFIGDGLTGTGSGSTQQFNVPTGATNLFLGFADAPSFQGAPNDYGDNPGSLSVSGSINTSTTPEPSAWSLLGLGLVALGAIRRKRSA